LEDRRVLEGRRTREVRERWAGERVGAGERIMVGDWQEMSTCLLLVRAVRQRTVFRGQDGEREAPGISVSD